HEQELLTPQGWRKPRLVFLCSMGDLFHPEVPADFIRRVFQVMKQCPQHQFQVLTKRSRRLRTLAKFLPWPDNVWMGVTVENARVTGRVADLQETPARVKFLSCEPLLGDIPKLPLAGINWVIVGGESGPSARVMRRTWVESVRRQCERANVAFCFKQWGGTRKYASGRLLDGHMYDDMPDIRLPAVLNTRQCELPLGDEAQGQGANFGDRMRVAAVKLIVPD
ncbi:MAG: DUF5131 family protein, partial [candidate division WOR-3 bacterium]